MILSIRLGSAAVLAALASIGCARTARTDAAPRPTAARRVAALDSAHTRQLCAAPDSVLAGRAACVLRNQSPPLRVF